MFVRSTGPDKPRIDVGRGGAPSLTCQIPPHRERALKDLSPADLSYLSQFGFDPELFASWREALRTGQLSAEGNLVQGKMLAPLEDSIHDMPKKGTPDRARIDELGEGLGVSRGGHQAIAAGDDLFRDRSAKAGRSACDEPNLTFCAHGDLACLFGG